MSSFQMSVGISTMQGPPRPFLSREKARRIRFGTSEGMIAHSADLATPRISRTAL
jgi:hypothetical protein